MFPPRTADTGSNSKLVNHHHGHMTQSSNDPLRTTGRSLIPTVLHVRDANPDGHERELWPPANDGWLRGMVQRAAREFVGALGRPDEGRVRRTIKPLPGQMGSGILNNSVDAWRTSGIRVSEGSPSTVDESVDVGAQANPSGIYPVVPVNPQRAQGPSRVISEFSRFYLQSAGSHIQQHLQGPGKQQLPQRLTFMRPISIHAPSRRISAPTIVSSCSEKSEQREKRCRDGQVVGGGGSQPAFNKQRAEAATRTAPAAAKAGRHAATAFEPLTMGMPHAVPAIPEAVLGRCGRNSGGTATDEAKAFSLPLKRPLSAVMERSSRRVCVDAPPLPSNSSETAAGPRAPRHPFRDTRSTTRGDVRASWDPGDSAVAVVASASAGTGVSGVQGKPTAPEPEDGDAWFPGMDVLAPLVDEGALLQPPTVASPRLAFRGAYGASSEDVCLLYRAASLHGQWGCRAGRPGEGAPPGRRTRRREADVHETVTLGRASESEALPSPPKRCRVDAPRPDRDVTRRERSGLGQRPQPSTRTEPWGVRTDDRRALEGCPRPVQLDGGRVAGAFFGSVESRATWRRRAETATNPREWNWAGSQSDPKNRCLHVAPRDASLATATLGESPAHRAAVSGKRSGVETHRCRGNDSDPRPGGPRSAPGRPGPSRGPASSATSLLETRSGRALPEGTVSRSRPPPSPTLEDTNDAANPSQSLPHWARHPPPLPAIDPASPPNACGAVGGAPAGRPQARRGGSPTDTARGSGATPPCSRARSRTPESTLSSENDEFPSRWGSLVGGSEGLGARRVTRASRAARAAGKGGGGPDGRRRAVDQSLGSEKRRDDPCASHGSPSRWTRGYPPAGEGTKTSHHQRRAQHKDAR